MIAPFARSTMSSPAEASPIVTEAPAPVERTAISRWALSAPVSTVEPASTSTSRPAVRSLRLTPPVVCIRMSFGAVMAEGAVTEPATMSTLEPVRS